MTPLDAISTDPQRRFTTLEGYREAGKGIYLVSGSRITAIALEPNPREFYDPEWGRFDDRPISTRCSRQEQLRLTARALGTASSSRTLSTLTPENPFLLPEEARQNPFVDPSDFNATQPLPPAPVLEDKPFHIFGRRQKWTVVGIIGTAGLFSGLSSNIYFPSLDAISKVSTISPSASLQSCGYLASYFSVLTSASGSQRQSRDCSTDHHVVPDHPRYLAALLGPVVRHPGTPPYLHRLLLSLYSGQYSSEHLAQLSCAFDLPWRAVGRKRVNC